jgi:hypothetical protein
VRIYFHFSKGTHGDKLYIESANQRAGHAAQSTIAEHPLCGAVTQAVREGKFLKGHGAGLLLMA